MELIKIDRLSKGYLINQYFYCKEISDVLVMVKFRLEKLEKVEMSDKIYVKEED